MASAPVRKSITVKASPETAYRVFTKEIDSWWPRSHHIGQVPLQRVIFEDFAGGRCYSLQTDGTECDWGQILVWDPPQRFAMAWMINPSWQYEPDPAKASEVDVRFTPEPGGLTRVDLEHRYFERHGEGYETMRSMVDQPGGWNALLQSFQAIAEQPVEAQ